MIQGSVIPRRNVRLGLQWLMRIQSLITLEIRMKEEEEKEEEEEKWKTLAGLSLSRQGDRIRGLELRQSFKLE